MSSNHSRIGLAAIEMPRAHLVGVCGSGMRACAEYLLLRGWNVSGSDLSAPSRELFDLIARGLRFHHGHSAAAIDADLDVLVYSAAVPEENPERQAARAFQVAERSYVEMLADLVQHRSLVAIAGTHGKSTVTALTGELLAQAGLCPSQIAGAASCQDGRSARAGRGEHFVLEACEYRRHFWNFQPKYGCILNIEPDHFDCFPTQESLDAAFAGFAARIARDGWLLLHESLAHGPAARAATCPVETFGTSRGSTWRLSHMRAVGMGGAFTLEHQGTRHKFSTRLPGQLNVWNSAAAAVMALKLGAAPTAVAQGLLQFTGVRRRLEMVGLWRGCVMLDDYAHHPTAVRAGLAAVREMFGDRRLVCAFQPHQASRLQSLLDDFATAFDQADEVLLAPIFGAREVPRVGGDASQRVRHTAASEPSVLTIEPLVQTLAGRLQERGQRVQSAGSLDQMERMLEDSLKPGDVFITMGAGNLDQVHHAFSRRIQRHSAAQRAARSLHVAQAGWPRPILSHTA